MISEIVVACMAVFMVIGAADKALFNNRFGYGEEFERGLSAMGPLAMCLVGVMCAAPAIGRAAAPALGPLFTAIGSDPSVAAGMIFGIDSGGLTLSIALAATHEAAMLSGLGLAASMGCVITYALPVSLSMCAPRSRPAVAKGLAAGIAAAPVSLFGVAAVSGYSLSGAFITGIPAFLIGGLMAFLLITRQDAAVRGCVLFGKLMIARTDRFHVARIHHADEALVLVAIGTRHDENDLHTVACKTARHTVAGRTQPAGDMGRKLPTEHQHSHLYSIFLF